MKRLASMDATERRQRETLGMEWAAGFTWSAHAAAAARIYREALDTITHS